jgi:hypothetical protein
MCVPGCRSSQAAIAQPQQEFHNMVTELELAWVRFLERHGIDVSYQTDVDMDGSPVPSHLPRGQLAVHRSWVGTESAPV